MTQNSYTQSENRNLQHENWNEKPKNKVRVVQFQIKTNNQLYMIIEEWKSIMKQTCLIILAFRIEAEAQRHLKKRLLTARSTYKTVEYRDY